MLDVFAEQASNERAAGPKDWITALEGQFGAARTVAIVVSY